MRKITICVMMMLPFIGFGQKKENGKIYIEHPAINVVEAFTKAMVAGDTSTMSKLMSADFKAFNPVGSRPHDKGQVKSIFLRNSLRWFNELDYYSIQRAEGSYPDALEYVEYPNDNSAVTVISWDIVKGVHKTTGIKVNTYLHRSFTLTKDHKIRRLLNYTNPEVVTKIVNAGSERKNGVLYNEHAYINKLRMMMGAAENGDFDKFYSFFDPKATFAYIGDPEMKNQSLTEVKAMNKELLERFDITEIEQVGYPDYVAYEMGDMGVLYSWWNFYFVRKSDKKEIKVPVHYQHDVNKDGKFTNEILYANLDLLK